MQLTSNHVLFGGLEKYLKEAVDIQNVHVYETIESTNKTAKGLAASGCDHGTVIISDSQTAGRGRYGRSFYSPSESGLYISIVLRPEFVRLTNVVMVTSAAAVITSEVIEQVAGVKCGIKWVNDLYLNEKKVCGILAEGSINAVNSQLDWIVLGIGININTKSFPDELLNTATSLVEDEKDKDVRVKIAAGLINRFLSPDTWTMEKEIMEKYRERQILLGQKVVVLKGNGSYEAEAVDVDDRGQLIVRKEDGSIEALCSGEVSARMK